jgi:hypothetical protein
MKKQRGYLNINTDGLAFFFIAGMLAVCALVICGPVIAYFAYQEHKEEKALIRECERNLPREFSCEIVKTAKPFKVGEDK